MKKLVICDFDGTLFNSPHPPGNSGWGRPITLSVDSFLNGAADVENGFNKTVLDAMIRYEKDPSVYSVLLTGRLVSMRGLIKRIIGDRVSFKEEHFSRGGKTEEFKKGVIEYLLQKFPDICEVEIWEDRKEHELSFLKFVREKGISAVSGVFTIGEPIKLKPEVIMELEKRLEERKKREALAEITRSTKK